MSDIYDQPPATASPTKTELKLIVDNSLLELEKRMTKSIGETLTEQNKIYMDHIVKITASVASLETKQKILEDRVKSQRSLAATIAAAASVLSGLVGFFISQISNH